MCALIWSKPITWLNRENHIALILLIFNLTYPTLLINKICKFEVAFELLKKDNFLDAEVLTAWG